MKKYWIMSNEKKETHVKNIYEKIIFTGKKKPRLVCHTSMDNRFIEGKSYQIIAESELGFRVFNEEGRSHTITKGRYEVWFRLIK